MTAVKIFEPPRIPSLDATEWLNTASGGPAELQGSPRSERVTMPRILDVGDWW
jgi:hypothetical protein